MKNIHILLIIFCFISINTYAQNEVDASDLLEKISIKYKNNSTSKMDIQLIIDVPETDTDITKTATVWLKKDQFVIDFDEQMIVSDNVSQWNYLKEVQEVQISNYDESTMIFVPSKVFNLYSEKYVYRVKGTYKNDKGESIVEVELMPNDKDYEVFKMIVTINSTKMAILQTKIFEKSGYNYVYKIIKLENNIKLEDSFFQFNPKKYGIEEDDITDLR